MHNSLTKISLLYIADGCMTLSLVEQCIIIWSRLYLLCFHILLRLIICLKRQPQDVVFTHYELKITPLNHGFYTSTRCLGHDITHNTHHFAFYDTSNVPPPPLPRCSRLMQDIHWTFFHEAIQQLNSTQ